jgi:hypothetical protein
MTKKTMRRSAVMLAVTAALGGQAMAFEIDTANDDVQVRWDNTVRYNVAQRVGTRDPNIGNAPNFDQGTYLFNKGDIVSNRVDLLSELDFVYQKKMGFRISAAAWYDGAYGDQGKSNPAIANPSYVNNEFSPMIKRYYQGPSGEFLDAFVFSNFDVAETPVKLKLGRHTVAWGESLFLGGAMHSVAYSQMPIDLQKGFATPGSEAKELFRPLNQFSGQAQVTDTLSVSGQYFLDWESYRYPEGGTFLGPVDFAFNGPDRATAGILRGKPAEPKKDGEYGLSARWSPAALDATLGFYYRRYADKLPQLLRTKGAEYNLIYADKIDLFGVSLAKNIGGVSVGAELSQRKNTPLNAKTLGLAATPFAQGDTPGPRGDTYHALVNVLGTVPKTALFDAATWAAEWTWSRWDKVTSGQSNFFAVGSPGCSTLGGAPLGEYAGCATKSYQGVSMAFTPTWYQVMPGVDLSMPLTYAVGIRGNAATVFGGNEGLGNYSLGLSADVNQKYRVELKYSGYVGQYTTGTAGCAAGTRCVTAQNGFTSLLQDRDFISLTFKTSF